VGTRDRTAVGPHFRAGFFPFAVVWWEISELGHTIVESTVTTRWVITGGRGQLGRALVAKLEEAEGHEILAAPSRAELDITDASAMARYFESLPSIPDVVGNAAAYTKVDLCETEEELANSINTSAPGMLAELCRKLGAKLVHVSTDYVFPGDSEIAEASRFSGGSRPPYTTEDETGPRSAYGRSKLGGEQRVLAASSDALVVRTSWVFGDGHNFIRAILRQVGLRRNGSTSGPLRVVDDQLGRPTYAVDLAAGLVGLVGLGASGLFHLANQGEATWWDLARYCVDAAGAQDLEIERGCTGDLNLPAPRPAYSVLDSEKAAHLGVKLRDWRDAVSAYLDSDASPLSEAVSPS
jgi:dTDP-4-dehydrorhamnose reductase